MRTRTTDSRNKYTGVISQTLLICLRFRNVFLKYGFQPIPLSPANTLATYQRIIIFRLAGCPSIDHLMLLIYTLCTMYMNPFEHTQEKVTHPKNTSKTPEKKKLFQDRLAELLIERFPDAKAATIEQTHEVANDVISRDEHVEHTNLLTILQTYGIDSSSLREEEGNFVLKVTNHFDDRRLPEGYAYKGGAARALLLRSLGVDPSYHPRDIDIVRLSTEEPYNGADESISREFMPDDFAFGHGVETLISKDTYFTSRDFTTNEVLATDTEVIATRACILDSVRHIIRLSNYERERIEDTAPNDKMLAKALRSYAEGIFRYGEAYLEDPYGWEYERYFVSPFWLALQLDRSFEVSRQVAEHYTDELIKRGQIPKNIADAEDAARYLLELLEGDSFYYRHAPIEQFNAERLAAQRDTANPLPKQEGFGRRSKATHL